MNTDSVIKNVRLCGKDIDYQLADNLYAEKVLRVTHYTDRLFKFRITRPKNFRFRSGEFVMIGLPTNPKPIFRAYSIASPIWDEELEFYSIKVPNGPLTENLQKIQKNDTILMRKKTTGTLVLDALLPGKRLYLLSTGTGVAPFASLIQDPEVYEKFKDIVLVQTARERDELNYAQQLVENLKQDELLKDFSPQLKSYFMTTREKSDFMGRITDLMQSGEFFENTGLPKINHENDRVMICGSIQMIEDCTKMCENFGLCEGANNNPGSFVVERAFVG